MSPVPRALILAPYFRTPAHLGNYRVGRFIRWFGSTGAQVVVVTGGDRDEIVDTPWGVEVAIRDPLRLYGGTHTAMSAASAGAPSRRRRRPNAWRRTLVHTIFVPEPSVLWARRVVRHPSVARYAEGARWVISSSPPEAPHLAAQALARRFEARLILDLRDGWLDDPLRPVLRRRWRQLVEAPLERRAMDAAAHVFVTSPYWRELLVRRLPGLAARTTVLSNAYPAYDAAGGGGAAERPAAEALDVGAGPACTLLYAGRFTGSRADQRVEALLGPLAGGLPPRAPNTGRIRLIGDHTPADRESAARLEPILAARGWQVSWEPRVPRAELLRQYEAADGLLLLAVSPAAVPSKIFEYLPTGKPIFAVTRADSAVASILADVPQAFLADGRQDDRVARGFAEACEGGEVAARVPLAYAESQLRATFLATLGILPATD